MPNIRLAVGIRFIFINTSWLHVHFLLERNVLTFKMVPRKVISELLHLFIALFFFQKELFWWSNYSIIIGIVIQSFFCSQTICPLFYIHFNGVRRRGAWKPRGTNLFCVMHPLVQVNRASLCLQSSSTRKNKELAQESFSIFHDLSPKKAMTVEERMAPVRIYFSKQANEEILSAWELHYSVKPLSSIERFPVWRIPKHFQSFRWAFWSW